MGQGGPQLVSSRFWCQQGGCSYCRREDPGSGSAGLLGEGGSEPPDPPAGARLPGTLVSLPPDGQEDDGSRKRKRLRTDPIP